jgi:hypothetical protein
MKSDYSKGVTAGLALAKKHPSFRCYPSFREYEIRAAISKLEDKYSAQIGELVCPVSGEPSYMRLSWYRDGIRDALSYGNAAKFVIVHYSGTNGYNVGSLVDRTVYDDPAQAWKRSWALDPQGHAFKSIDALYVNGAARELGIEDIYGLGPK